MAVKKINSKSWWSKRDNLKNKPSLSYRTIEVIEHIMVKNSLALGLAIEKLITTPNLYKRTIEELKANYPDIED